MTISGADPDETVIRPTNTCFDDALDFIAERVKRDVELALHETRLILVHGICLAPEGPLIGEPFAHAWVEERAPGEPKQVWQGGILDGERVYYGIDADEFAQMLRPQKVTRYTVREAWLENERTEHFGPWVAEYEALCRKPGEERVFTAEQKANGGN